MNKKVIILVMFLLFVLLKEPFMMMFSKTVNYDFLLTAEYNDLKKEYDKLLNFNSPNPSYVISKVLFKDPLEFLSEVTILKGSLDGINVGDIVLNEEGLIGTIKRVSNHSSVVSLLKSADTKIAVKIGDMLGLLESDNGTLMVKNIVSNVEVNVDDEVYTAPFSLLGEDIYIGKVSEVLDKDLSRQLIINPAVSFDNIDYVFIRKVIKDE